MDYRLLSIETWKELDGTGDRISGYKSIWLGTTENMKSNAHIFKDEFGKYHIAIKDNDVQKNAVEDPGVNGLQINLNQYRLSRDSVDQFIDIRCNIDGNLQEFTEVTREIVRGILDDHEPPVAVVDKVIRKWRAFWGTENKPWLSEEKQIGLICELKVLEGLCSINVTNGLNAWAGPTGQKQDFVFSAWTLEVKGTKKSGHVHTINGIDQLKPELNKNLALVSFRVAVLENANSISLPEMINRIEDKALKDRTDLIVKFRQLLAKAGYSPLYDKEYRKFRIEILDSVLFVVDDCFPSLTSDKLATPLSNRVTSIRYDISLDGIEGTPLNDVHWGDYFY